MKKITENWLLSSNYDIETAYYMLKTGRYIYVIFMCHLATEKLLKAIVSELQEEKPPKTHDLVFLTKLIKLKLPDKFEKLIADLSSVSIPTRYPEEMSQISKKYNKSTAKKYFNETKELLLWLKQHEKLKK